jgi:hypothetical protein
MFSLHRRPDKDSRDKDMEKVDENELDFSEFHFLIVVQSHFYLTF